MNTVARARPRRIDAHHHVWDLSIRPQPWMTGHGMGPLRRNFSIDDLNTASARQHIDGTIVVHTVSDVAETNELLDLADASPSIVGVVGFVDISQADVGDELDRLIDRDAGRWLVGIRSMVQYEPDPLWLDRPDVQAGMRAIADRGLVHELLIVPAQIDAAARAARRVEHGSFVIDHLAKPAIADGSWEPWASDISRLAALPNVAAKLSGLVTEANWAAWTTAQLQPYVDRALTAFGSQRLLFGSDWPVCTVAGTYDEVADAAARLVGDLSPTERADVFGGNATKMYGSTTRPYDASRRQQGAT